MVALLRKVICWMMNFRIVASCLVANCELQVASYKLLIASSNSTQFGTSINSVEPSSLHRSSLNTHHSSLKFKPHSDALSLSKWRIVHIENPTTNYNLSVINSTSTIARRPFIASHSSLNTQHSTLITCN